MAIGRAVVIGGGIAGLLAAGVLAGEYSSVVVVDRDDLDGDAVPRAGVPQGRHTHLLLPAGLDAIERLQPGFTADLLSQGGREGDLQERVLMCVGPARLAPGTCSARFVSTSRSAVESSLYRRVSSLPGVQVHSGTSVLDLTFTPDEHRVTGIRVAARDGGPAENLPAALVVDASGRGSRTPEWLSRRGYAAPAESQVRIDERYVTRVFRAPSEPGEGSELVIAQSGSAANPRSGVAAHQHADVWSASLSGYHGDQPARDLPGFRDFARSLDAPHLARFLETAQPLDEGASFRFVSNVRRHYERLARFPGGLLVIGDAVCSLDPVKGQGMTLAALQATVLARCLREATTRLAARFFPAVASVLADPWGLATAPGRSRPGSGRRNPAEAALDGYLDLLLRGAAADPVLAGSFLRVAALVAPASTLLNPRTAGRVLLGEATRLRHRHTPPTGSGPAAPAIDRSPHDAVRPTEENRR
ncbi:MAG: FAD-dependent oxidoreductase [Dermatophilaceae bacterium]